MFQIRKIFYRLTHQTAHLWDQCISNLFCALCMQKHPTKRKITRHLSWTKQCLQNSSLFFWVVFLTLQRHVYCMLSGREQRFFNKQEKCNFKWGHALLIEVYGERSRGVPTGYINLFRADESKLCNKWEHRRGCGRGAAFSSRPSRSTEGEGKLSPQGESFPAAHWTLTTVPYHGCNVSITSAHNCLPFILQGKYVLLHRYVTLKRNCLEIRPTLRSSAMITGGFKKEWTVSP